MDAKKRIAVLATIAFAIGGCTTRTIEVGGMKYHSVRFANKETIGDINVQLGTNIVSIGSYRSDQVAAIEVAVAAAVKAAIASMKP